MTASLRAATTMLLCIVVLMLVGCSTFVTSKKADEMSNSWGSDGDQYYLPMPGLAVTPKIDGTVQVEPKYWADPEQKFAIKGSTFLGKYKLKVKKNELGLLEEVDLSGTSTAELAKSATGAAAEIVKERFNAQEARRNDAKAKQEARNTAIATARATLLEQENLLAQYKELEQQGALTADDVKAQQKEVAKARAKLDALLGQSTAAVDGGSADTSSLDKGKPLGTDDTIFLPDRKAWGPVYFRIVLARDAVGVLTQVKLEPIHFPTDKNSTQFEPQRQFDTVNVSDAVSPPAVIIEGPRTSDNKTSMTVRLPSGTRFDDLIPDKGKVLGPAGEEWAVQLTKIGLENDKAVVTISKMLEKGNYNLLLLQKQSRPVIVVGFKIS